MYKLIIKPLFFLFDPEKIHHFVFKVLRFKLSIPGIKHMSKWIYGVSHPSLKRELMGLTFENPVGLAAGFDKNALLLNQLEYLGFGFVELGTVTPLPQAGNPKKRLFRLPEDEALINRMGFNNDGVEAVVERLKNRKTQIVVGGNIGKNTATANEHAKADYITNIKALHPYVDYLVVNVSCPNVGNTSLLNDKNYLIELLTELKALNASLGKEKPMLLKIGPDRDEKGLDEVIEVIQKTGIAGVISTNTATDRSELKTSKERLTEIGNGGLSGRPLTKRSTEVIKYLADKSNKSFVIIGVGGIHSEKDALEKLEAGADLVQVYTGFIYEGPRIIKRINKAIIAQNNKK